MSERAAERRPIQSMTGYAIASRDTPAGQVSVELRSVNSRFLDLSFRMPDELRPSEPALRELIVGAVARGKLECRVNLRAAAGAAESLSVDEALVERLARVGERVADLAPGAAPLTVGELLRWPGVLGEPASAESLLPEVLAAGRRALEDFTASRAREGGKLAAFILERADAIAAIVERVAAQGPELLQAWERKLVERLRNALQAEGAQVPLEETMARVRQEVTAYGLRIDIAEEIGRLQTHLAELRRILSGHGPVGKRLDFLLQEFNREANTLGSKAAAVDLTQASIDLKLLIEQIREQTQNLE